MKKKMAMLKQTGFSLVELMVALTIGLVVVLAISSIFTRSHLLTREQEVNMEMAESARFAMAEIGRIVRQQGYAEMTNVSIASDGIGDVLEVSYLPRGDASGTYAMPDCGNQALNPSGGAVTIRLFVDGNQQMRSLWCQQTQDGVTTSAPLADQIETIQFMLGYARANCAGSQASSDAATTGSYRTAEASVPLSTALALRTGFIIRSAHTVENSETGFAGPYRLLGPDIAREVRQATLTAQQGALPENYRRRLYSSTWFFRNGCGK